MFHYNQIITLLNIFDDQIYTTLSEENVSGTVNSFISALEKSLFCHFLSIFRQL